MARLISGSNRPEEGSAPKTKKRTNRRNFIRTGAGLGAIGLAGCTGGETGNGDGNNGGDDGDGGDGSDGDAELSFKIGGLYDSDQNDMDSYQPSSSPPFANYINEIADGQLNAQWVGGGQLCVERDCADKIDSKVLTMATSSSGNSSLVWPGLTGWSFPYMWPTYSAQGYVLTQPETWERFWIPMMEQYGAFPMCFSPMFARTFYIGTDTAGSRDERFRVPSDIEGLKVRRSKSSISHTVIEELGGEPVDVAWGDTAQGLKSGVVDALSTWGQGMMSGGMVESIGEAILTGWSNKNGSIGWGAGVLITWAHIDWVQEQNDEHLDILAEAGREATRDQLKLSDELAYTRAGMQDPPPENEWGSAFHDHDITVNELDEDERAKWREPIRADKNKDLYQDTIDTVADELGDDTWLDYAWEKARESSVPDQSEDLEIYGWWDDYLDEIMSL